MRLYTIRQEGAQRGAPGQETRFPGMLPTFAAGSGRFFRTFVTGKPLRALRPAAAPPY